MVIEPGLVGDYSFAVIEEDTAYARGGKHFPKVLSTPRMIGLMEQTAHQALAPFLGQGQTSVGSTVNIRHLAATPVGMIVRIRAELLQADGRRMLFRVEAWDEVDKIGEGEHERFIIDLNRFNDRLDKKSQQGKQVKP